MGRTRVTIKKSAATDSTGTTETEAPKQDCQAADLGHHNCPCGRDGCGDKATY